jgi:hypothetical protein
MSQSGTIEATDLDHESLRHHVISIPTERPPEPSLRDGA